MLDVMGTLVHDPFHLEMPAFFGLSLEELMRLKHPDAWVRFEHGELSEDAFLRCFFADEREYDRAAFVGHVRSAYRFLEGMEPLLGELRDRGVPMHAFSNYPCWYCLIEQELELSRFLDWTFVSCETGVRKPDPEAYCNAVRTLEVPAERCLFVDDRRSNCVAAREAGMDAVIFEGADQLRRALQARGVL